VLFPLSKKSLSSWTLSNLSEYFLVNIFHDKCCEHNGDRDPEEKGITIGRHESAWLADLVGAFVLDNTKSHFRETMCCGPHRDAGMEAFNNKLSCNDMLQCRTKFRNPTND